MKRGSSYALETILPNRASTDGQTDGRTDRVIPVYPPPNFVAGGIINYNIVPLKFLCPVFRQRGTHQ